MYCCFTFPISLSLSMYMYVYVYMYCGIWRGTYIHVICVQKIQCVQCGWLYPESIHLCLYIMKTLGKYLETFYCLQKRRLKTLDTHKHWVSSRTKIAFTCLRKHKTNIVLLGFFVVVFIFYFFPSPALPNPVTQTLFIWLKLWYSFLVVTALARIFFSFSRSQFDYMALKELTWIYRNRSGLHFSYNAIFKFSLFTRIISSSARLQ